MSVGTELQAARKQRHLSISEVSETTKIQPWVLESLEEDRLTQIMSPIYVKGFLSTYAKFLHQDPQPLLAGLVWPQDASQEELPPPAQAREPFKIKIQIPWALLKRVGTVALAGAAVGVLIAINPLQWIPKLSLSSIVVPKMASVTPGPMLKPAPKPALASLDEVAPQSGPMDLLLSAKRPTWIRVKVDGKLMTQERLGRGATEHWQAVQRFEVIIAKPSQVELSLNGTSIDAFAVAHQGRLLITRRGIVQLPADST